ncbi:MAG: hypothetical protein U0353_32910 [Sandaracinus sp.]
MQDMGDRVRQLHRILDLGFPEITKLLGDLSRARSPTTIVLAFPTARAFEKTNVSSLAAVKYDRTHTVGVELATKLLEMAKRSVGQHHGAAYQLQARHAMAEHRGAQGTHPIARREPLGVGAKARDREAAHDHRRHR